MREPAARANGYSIARDLSPRLVDLASLQPLGRATRSIPPGHIRKLGRSLAEFGFVLPIVIDADLRVIAGGNLVLAAKKLGLNQVPAVTITDLSEAQLHALRLALNRLAEGPQWKPNELALEFREIFELDPEFDLTIAGFEMGEIDVALAGDLADDEDDPPGIDEGEPITKPGDKWLLGSHAIMCADACVEESYRHLLGGDLAQMVFTDPPYNLPIEDNVSGLGAIKHGEFRQASGELSPREFTAFLTTSFSLAALYAADGSIHFACMDWRHSREILDAGDKVFDQCLNLVVWNKSNAGMGSLYRSRHELIYVFKKGKGPHINNVQLGRHGRNRTNVWDYPSQTTLGLKGKGKLGLHPTVKPVALVADAIRDCSKRGGLILDPFGGAGTTLIAAEKTGRKAALIEIEPKFVDVTVRRWQRLTGAQAIHAETDASFGA